MNIIHKELKEIMYTGDSLQMGVKEMNPQTTGYHEYPHVLDSMIHLQEQWRHYSTEPPPQGLLRIVEHSRTTVHIKRKLSSEVDPISSHITASLAAQKSQHCSGSHDN